MRRHTIFLLLLSVLSFYIIFKYNRRLGIAEPPVFDEEPRSDDRFTRRIVAVGDLHADFPNTLKVLRMGGVITEEGNWSGDVDFFVQTGDIVDRGDDTLKIYEFMEKLRGEALAVGGKVLSNLGNHEYMNAIGDWRYVPQSEIKTFGSVADRQKMLSTGWVGRAWSQNYTLATRLPLHFSLGDPNIDYDPSQTSEISHSAIAFMHGGLSPTYADMTPFPSRVNTIGHSLLDRLQNREQPPPHPPSPYRGLPSDTPLEERELYGTNGPLWYRGLAMDSDEKVCGEIDEILDKIGCRRIILGHTPNFENVLSRCGGKVIIIDTGISHAYGGVLSALSITYTLTPSSTSSAGTRDKNSEWVEKEVVKAIYPTHIEVLATNEKSVRGYFW